MRCFTDCFQVVEGMDYCIVAAIGSSSACPKGQGHEDADLDECPVEKKEVENYSIVSDQFYSNWVWVFLLTMYKLQYLLSILRELLLSVMSQLSN